MVFLVLLAFASSKPRQFIVFVRHRSSLGARSVVFVSLTNYALNPEEFRFRPVFSPHSKELSIL